MLVVAVGRDEPPVNKLVFTAGHKSGMYQGRLLMLVDMMNASRCSLIPKASDCEIITCVLLSAWNIAHEHVG